MIQVVALCFGSPREVTEPSSPGLSNHENDVVEVGIQIKEKARLITSGTSGTQEI